MTREHTPRPMGSLTSRGPRHMLVPADDLRPPGPPPWQLEAACREMPTEMFFPIGHGPLAEAQILQAKEVCRQCGVRDECLQYAMAGNMQYGVFGGLSEDERRERRRMERSLYDRAGAVSEPA